MTDPKTVNGGREESAALRDALMLHRTQRYADMRTIAELKDRLASAQRAQFWCFAAGFVGAEVSTCVVLWSKGYLLETWCAPSLLTGWSVPWWFCP